MHELMLFLVINLSLRYFLNPMQEMQYEEICLSNFQQKLS